MNIVDKLTELHRQATVERSHHYVGNVAAEASREIIRLQLEVERLEEYRWMYEGLSK